MRKMMLAAVSALAIMGAASASHASVCSDDETLTLLKDLYIKETSKQIDQEVYARSQKEQETMEAWKKQVSFSTHDSAIMSLANDGHTTTCKLITRPSSFVHTTLDYTVNITDDGSYYVQLFDAKLDEDFLQTVRDAGREVSDQVAKEKQAAYEEYMRQVNEDIRKQNEINQKEAYERSKAYMDQHHENFPPNSVLIGPNETAASILQGHRKTDDTTVNQAGEWWRYDEMAHACLNDETPQDQVGTFKDHDMSEVSLNYVKTDQGELMYAKIRASDNANQLDFVTLYHAYHENGKFVTGKASCEAIERPDAPKRPRAFRKS